MDMLIAAGGAGQETAAAVLRLAYLAGVPAPEIVVFDSDVAQRPAGDGAQTRMEVLKGLDQRFCQLGAATISKVALINPTARGGQLLERVERIDHMFASTGYVSPDDESLLSLLLDQKQRQTPVANGFHGEPAVGSLLFAGSWARGAFRDFEQKLSERADTGLRVVLTGSVAGGVGTSVLPYLTGVLRGLRQTGKRVEVCALLQLPWFTLIRSGDDPRSLDPDVTDAQLDRNCAGLIRGYLQDYTDNQLDLVMLLGLPKKAQRVSHGGDRQLETRHYLCLCAGIAALNLCSRGATDQWLGEAATGVFGLALNPSKAASTFDGPPAGPALFRGDGPFAVRGMLDVARTLKAYTRQLSKELEVDAPSVMHHHSVSRALATLQTPQRVQEFTRTVLGFDNLHHELLGWLKDSLDSKVGSVRQDPLGGAFDPPEGLDAITSAASSSVLKVTHRPGWFVAPPRRLLRLPREAHPDPDETGRDLAWKYVEAIRTDTLRRLTRGRR